jgi:hypothetical protein
MPEPSKELRLARRELATIQQFTLLEDFRWQAALDSWSIRFSLICPVPVNEFVPAITNWYAVISSSYPWGDIKIYPDKIGGIIYTFPHQDYNRLSEKYPWREGDLCVRTSLIKWGRADLIEEPFGAAERLHWHIRRSVEWIITAASGELSPVGDPFELPQLPNRNVIKIAFSEDEASFAQWLEVSQKAGFCRVKSLPDNSAIYYVDAFELEKDREVSQNWGSLLSEKTTQHFDGIWIRVGQVPVLPPWQLPETWQELFATDPCKAIDVKNLLLTHYLRRKKRNLQFLLLGFPIPETNGTAHVQIHWLCIKLKALPILKNFTNLDSQIKQGFAIEFANGKKIDWVLAENWSKKQVTARGVLPESLANSNIILIGAGAIGSQFAELLIRLGCRRILVIDEDVVNIGNMSRHTLTSSSVQKHKAEALAKHLNEIFPFVEASFENRSLASVIKSKPRLFEEADIIIEATGSDEVLHALSELLSGREQLFVSLSSGIRANRMFGYLHKHEGIKIETDFRSRITPWLKKERSENAGLKLPREGIGCWHPTFPARIDDVNMMLCAFIKVFEVRHSLDELRELIVIEKAYDENGVFNGVRLIEDNDHAI